MSALVPWLRTKQYLRPFFCIFPGASLSLVSEHSGRSYKDRVESSMKGKRHLYFRPEWCVRTYNICIFLSLWVLYAGSTFFLLCRRATEKLRTGPYYTQKKKQEL